MLKKTITYTDYNGNERTEDFYFNLSKIELMKLEASIKGGMQKMMDDIAKANDNFRVIEVFEKLIKLAYGVKDEDGKHFRKSKEATEEFVQSEAYSVLLFELLSDADKSAEFFRGVVPADLMAQAEAMNSKPTLLPNA